MSDMETIDKKINQSANDHLDSLEKSLKDMDFDSIKSEINEMLEDCSLDELKKVAKILVTIAKKSFQDDKRGLM